MAFFNVLETDGNVLDLATAAATLPQYVWRYQLHQLGDNDH